MTNRCSAFDMAKKTDIALITIFLGAGGVLAGAAVFNIPAPFKALCLFLVIGFCLYGLCLILGRFSSAELTPEIMDVERQKPVSRKEAKELIVKADRYLSMYTTISKRSNEMPLTDEQATVFKTLCNIIMRLKQKKAKGIFEQIEEATISLSLEMTKNSEHPQLKNLNLFEKGDIIRIHEDRRVISNAESILDCLGDVMYQPFLDCMISVKEDDLPID